MLRWARWRLAFTTLVGLLLPMAMAAAQGTEVIRGRVLAPDRRPIADASITITGLVTQAVLAARTNSRGEFTAVSPGADGDYVIRARAIGYKPLTMRLTRSGLASVLVADITLQVQPFELDTLIVSVRRTLPQRADRPSIGGLERDVLGGALFSLDPSDLMGLAALTAGVLTTVGDSTTYSVLGAAANQNSLIVDGMKFSGDNLPRDAIGSAKLITTTYDPARGQFSGGQVSIRTKGGSDLFQAVVRGQSADRFTTWADPTSPMAAPRIQMASGSISGPIRKSRTHYLVAADLSYNATESFSLLAPKDVLLSQFGLSADTVNGLRQALGLLGIPPSGEGVPNDRLQNRETMFARFDWTPSSTVALTLNLNGNLRQQGGSGVSQLSFPSVSSHSTSQRLSLGASFSGYVGGLLDEFNAQIRRGDNNGSPYVALAGGSVRVGVQFDGGRDGLTSLRFGGGSSSASHSSSNSVEMTNELSHLTRDNRHRIKFGQSLEGDWESSFHASNRLGTYAYQTLADLATNHPASYTRTLSSRELANRGSITGLWVGDEWRASDAIQFQGGMRIDIAHQGVLPAYNPVVDSLFGLRTDQIPRQLGLSPRLGFSWASPARRGAAKGARAGVAPSFNGAGSDAETIALARPGTAPGITVSGGMGAFRGVVDPEDIAGLIDATGLPSTTRYLACAGDATPVPQWAVAGGTVADVCLDGSGPGVFSVSQPNVSVFDPSFRSPVSWRANLGVEGVRVLGGILAINGTYSLGLNRASDIDLNLHRTPSFTVAAEASRPVFVAPSSIVPETGILAPGAARIVEDFGRVTNTLSDLRNIATQLNATFAPRRPLFGRIPFNIQYVYSHQRALDRGFNGTTAGDPFLKEWAVGRQPVHQVVVTATPRVWLFSLGVRLNVLSGTPYTPVVVGDINGDGRSNDRAFIPDPATTADPPLATQMNDLLAAAPAGARACLKLQFGRIAGQNSCRTGWQVRTDLNLNFAPPEDLGVGSRLRATVNLLNATGALVRLFGLDNTALGRSASSITPDSRLLYVTGFDPATQRFQYRVNQLFGEPQDFGAARRRFAPFQVQVGLEYKLGGSRPVSLARSLGLIADKKAPPLTADQVRQRLQKLSADPLAEVMRDRDSLGLTPEQVSRLDTISANFRSHADSVFAPLVAFIAKSGAKVADADLSNRLAKLQPEIRKLLVRATASAADVLTLAQRQRLPALFAATRQ